jgi:RNA polymerase sigma-70 factor (ECF subfamily)
VKSSVALSFAEPSPGAPAIAVAEVFREHARVVFRTLRYLGVSEADVADAVQDVFVVVHDRGRSFEGRSSVRTWLFGISVRVASRYRRRERRQREKTTPLGEIAAEVADLDRVEARSLLCRLLDRLDADKRAVFVLHEVEELKVEEVAELLEIPLGTAYLRLRAARQELEEAAGRLARADRRATGRST